MKQRDTFLDFSKGIAIFLVVLGHVLEKSMQQKNEVYEFIYLFHMPFFFMLSGYLACRTKAFDSRFYLKKIRSLLLPFFFVGISFTVLDGQYQSFFCNCFHNGYWFLLSLFFYLVLILLGKKFGKETKNRESSDGGILAFYAIHAISGGGNFTYPKL